jgi:GNAT superfamily N-acetyltransferase
MKTTIRIAQPGDAAAACDVLRRSILQCCVDDHRNDETILGHWLGNKTPENVATWFQSPANLSLVAVAGSDVIGVAILTRAGKICLLYLCPDARFAGTGKALLQAIETHAAKNGVRSLQVASTITAQSFYTRNGFVVTGTTTSAFGSEAVAMSKKLDTAGYPRKGTCGCAAA